MIPENTALLRLIFCGIGVGTLGRPWGEFMMNVLMGFESGPRYEFTDSQLH